MTDYISWIRSKVGHDPIILNFAGACVVNGQGQVLLQNRSANGETWGFPGGAMEFGESAEETAVREVREETGLDIQINHLVGIYTKYFATYANGDQAQAFVISFHATPIGGNLKIDNKETFGLEFFNPRQAPPLFNQQHQDTMNDFIAQKQAVYR